MRRGVSRLVRPSVPGQVEEDHLESAVGEIGRQAPAQLVVQQETVHEHENSGPLAVAFVVEAEAFDFEGGLFEGPLLEEPAQPGQRGQGLGATAS